MDLTKEVKVGLGTDNLFMKSNHYVYASETLVPQLAITYLEAYIAMLNE